MGEGGKEMKKQWKIIFIIISLCFLGFRICFSERYILFMNGIYGNQILHKESFLDSGTENEERLKIIFYRSHDNNKIGMISLRKGDFLFLKYYKYYQRFEVDQKQHELLFLTQSLKDRWNGLANKNITQIENTDEIIFSDYYKTYPKGLFNGMLYRDVYCGKVDNASSKWLDGINSSDFRYRYVDGNDTYFIIDDPKE